MNHNHLEENWFYFCVWFLSCQLRHVFHSIIGNTIGGIIIRNKVHYFLNNYVFFHHYFPLKLQLTLEALGIYQSLGETSEGCMFTDRKYGFFCLLYLLFRKGHNIITCFKQLLKKIRKHKLCCLSVFPLMSVFPCVHVIFLSLCLYKESIIRLEPNAFTTVTGHY